ncbi:hypothetical protein IB75_15595 [Nitrosococcus oceani C-27]|uniref:Uncharacterized protein n=1 Tax=Nitrosococcus oceani C-27 TaxID=314279 RepID=A0A0E2YY30_9GAMM|nr:hypothetical protein IB75_15595 [Nitrosococcus oceani C-27]KFI21405.1 hypothetical protein HW44_15250 [Nitrosococcus oceani]
MIYLFLFYFSFAIILYFVARKKGREPVFWAGLGFFFGPLALFILFFSKEPQLPKVSKTGKKLPRRSGKRAA